MRWLFVHYCPGGAVVISQAFATAGTPGGINVILCLPFKNRSGGAFVKTAAAFYTVFGYFVSHGGATFEQIRNNTIIHFRLCENKIFCLQV